ncbi:hypothetical protein ACX6XY_04790 [Streptomyces sp. O3]
MSDNSVPVDPYEIPVFTGDLEVLDAKVKALREDGEKLSGAAGDVHTTFGGLSAFYQAPEAEKLFASTQPVVTTADDLQLDVSEVASALGTYAETVRPLTKRLEELRQEAIAFRAMTTEDSDWREDGDKVEDNNQRYSEIGKVWGQFQEAEVACYNAIVALTGGTALKMNGEPGQKGHYGYTGDVLSQAAELPWGKPVEESIPWYQSYEYVGDFFEGVLVDGVWGTIKGLGTLVGVDGWDAAGQAWTGLGKLLTGLVVGAFEVVPGGALAVSALPDGKVTDWIDDSRKAVVETGKALIAYDQWDTQPGRAAGATTFNVVTTVLTGGATGAAAGAGKAGAVAKTLSLAGKAGRVIDPITYLGKGAGLGVSKIGDAIAALRSTGQIDIPPLPDNAVTLPDGARLLDDGTLYLPDGARLPDGAIELADGRVTVPDDVPVVPEDAIPVTITDKTTGTTTEAFMLTRGPEAGTIVDGRMNTIQDAKAAPPDIVDQPATRTDAEQPVLVGAGTRADTATAISGRTDNTMTGPRMDLDSSNSGRGPGPAGGSGAADNATGGGSRAVGSGDGLTRSSSGGHEPPSGGHGTGPGSGGLPDDLGRTGDDAAHGGDTGPAGSNSSSTPRAQDERPPFMRDGDNPYGPPGSLTPDQIKEIQVYRANHEPGYFKRFYYEHGPGDYRRLSTRMPDESGYAPVQLKPDPSIPGRYIPASDAPPPLPEKMVPGSRVEASRLDVRDQHTLDQLDEFAGKRRSAIDYSQSSRRFRGLADEELVLRHSDEAELARLEAGYDYSDAMRHSTKQAETYGEAVAEYQVVPEHYPNATKQTLHGPRNGNDQFDQVWEREDGGFVVVEAKSDVGTALNKRDLPGGGSAMQGTREYFLDIIRKMYGRERQFPSEGELADKLTAALDEGRLDYILVKGKSDGGQYAGYVTEQFDIGKGRSDQ